MASQAAATAPQEAPPSQAQALVMASPAAASAQQVPMARSIPAAPAGSAEEPPQPPAAGRAEAPQDPAARLQPSSAPHTSPREEGRPRQPQAEQQQQNLHALAPSSSSVNADAEASSIAAGGRPAACQSDGAHGQATGSQSAASQRGKGQALASLPEVSEGKRNERHLARPELIKEGSDSGDWVKLNGTEAEEAKQPPSAGPQAADPRQQLRQLQNLRKLPEQGAATDNRALGASFKSLSQYTQLADLLREAPSAEQ